MADTRIEIVVPGEATADTLAQLQSQLPAGSSMVASATGAPPLSQLLTTAARSSAELPDRIAGWWYAASAGPGIGPVLSLLLCAAILALAWAVERIAVAPLTRRLVPPADPSGYPDRLRRAAWWALARAIELAAFAVIAGAELAVVQGAGPAMPALGALLLATVFRFRAFTGLAEALFAGADATRRPTGLTDDEARAVMRLFVRLLVVIAALACLRGFVGEVVGAGDSGALVAVATRAAELSLLAGSFVALRRPFARLIASAFAAESPPDGFLARCARNWYLFYVAIAALALATEAHRYLVPGAVYASASRYSMTIFILAPFVIAGLRIWRDGLLARPEGGHRGLTVGIFALLEGVAIVLVAVLVLVAWQVDPFATDAEGSPRIVPRLVTAGLMLAAGISVWRAARAFLDAWAPERPQTADPTADGDVGGPGGSRLATVYPVIRMAASAVIISMTGLLALAAMGVEILPLIAGAGIVGLAVGFGSQTLVKDVISGMFFLWEDAFRVGEFIVTDKGKGMVEKILLRSVRLRHPRGQIYTIPFGTMGTIQNHSRDWVKIKFTFEVQPTEDLEKVRKLVKKVGAALMEDPELEGKFIDPMKSQGAVAMVGPNYQIGVKFTCPPGQQFLIRRKAYAALQKALEQSGIRLATPRVSVDSIEGIAAAAAVTASGTGGAPKAP